MTPRSSYAVPLPGGRVLQLGPRTRVMGIINVTPDSFADGGMRIEPARAIAAGLDMVSAGADILDVGGESTRPGAEPVSASDELRRVLPVLDGLAGQVDVPISIDTYKADVAEAALAHGATLINDVSGLRYDPGLAPMAAAHGAGLILAHTRGRSREMYREATYGVVGEEIAQELAGSLEVALDAGVSRDRVIVDPGLGFAKRAEHTYAALAQLDRLRDLDRPILVGPSRKSFLRAALGECPPALRDWGTAAAVASAVMMGAHIVRVHGVREMVQVVRVVDDIRAHRDRVPARSSVGRTSGGSASP